MADRLALALPPWAEGVLVIGDVHGQARLFQAAVDLATAERRYVLSLGDLVDRGPDNAGCVRLMLDLLGRKTGTFIRGNHDDKLHRTLKGNPTSVDSDLAVTLEQLDAAPDSKALKRGFCSAFRAAPFVATLGNSVMVHGAFARAMLASRTFHPRLKALALYGETASGGGGSKPVRTYRWAEKVRAGMTVVIGHHPISDRVVLVRANKLGGKVVHLDCGAGKGRGLGVLRLASDGRIENASRIAYAGHGPELEPAPLVMIEELDGKEEIG